MCSWRTSPKPGFSFEKPFASGCCAVALLVLLPRATRARIVSSHLGARAHRLGRLRLRRAGLKLQIPRLTLLALFNLPGLFLRFGWLHQEKEPYCFRIDS